jgi:hypothetical protein
LRVTGALPAAANSSNAHANKRTATRTTTGSQLPRSLVHTVIMLHRLHGHPEVAPPALQMQPIPASAAQ